MLDSCSPPIITAATPAKPATSHFTVERKASSCEEKPSFASSSASDPLTPSTPTRAHLTTPLTTVDNTVRFEESEGNPQLRGLEKDGAMHTITIRRLSAPAIEQAAANAELVGVTSDGALVGVLVPADSHTVQRIIDRDREDIAASIAEAEAELAAGGRLTTLADLLDETPRPGVGRQPTYTRLTIRELSGSRIQEASEAGEILIVMRERVVLALLVPVTAKWVEELVERNVTDFLNGRDNPPRKVTAGLSAPVERHPHRALIRYGHRRRAFGIKIIGDAPDDAMRLVGVVTNTLANVVAGPVERPLPSMREVEVFDEILALTDELSALLEPEDELIGLGLEIGGHVHDGRVIYSANANKWDRFPLADRLSESLKLPVILQNDANALAVFERRFHGIDDNNFAVVLVTDSGVGCGLVLNGHVYHGVRGMAGELGHIPVALGRDDSIKCRCENPGCLEGIATPQAIEFSLMNHHGYRGTYEDALHAEGDDTVGGVFEQAGAAMGRAVSTLINLLNLSAIVFYAPQSLFGMARPFRIDADIPLTGAAKHYMSAMTQTIRAQGFSTGAKEDCRFFVRTSSQELGAVAAAACLIRHVDKLSER